MIRDIIRRFISVFLVLALQVALLLAAAGSVAWTRAWVFLGFSILLFAVNSVVLLAVNPEVIAARARIGVGTKTFDKVFAVLYAASLLALPVIAGTEIRLVGEGYGWLAGGAGLALMAFGNVFVLWSMAVNRHLEPTVRIQEERAHTVITDGPYRWVRHPMYVGVLLQNAGVPLVLGSVWAWAAVAAIVVFLVVRTAFEDRTLHGELDGYRSYAATTRYRLLPGVW